MKKVNLTKLMLMAIGLGLFILVGCESKDNSSSSLTPDEASVEDIIAQDANQLFGVEIMGEDDPSSFSKTLAESAIGKFVPIADGEVLAYGRRVRFEKDRIVIVVAPDSQSAVATLRVKLVGKFVIKLKDTTAANKGLILKDINQVMERKVHFVRNPSDSARRWRADSLTAGFGKSVPGTLNLGGVKIIIKNGAKNNVFQFVNPLNYWMSVSNVPNVALGDEVIIEATVTNSTANDKAVAFIHRGENRGEKRGRIKERMNDAGLFGDRVAGDNIYTIRFVVGATDFDGLHVGALDFFSKSTLFDTELPYNALTVHIPYKK